MQLANKTVSLFHGVLVDRERQFQKTLLEGVTWAAKDVSTVTEDGLRTASQYIVRIPYQPSVEPVKGDYMVLGDVAYAANMRELYGADCMVVLAVTNNMDAPMGKHVKVVGA